MNPTISKFVRTTKYFKLVWTILVEECDRHTNDTIILNRNIKRLTTLNSIVIIILWIIL